MEEFEVLEEKPRASSFLKVLCILTFIGSGYYFLYYLLFPLIKPMLPQLLDSYQQMLPQEAELNDPMTLLFNFLGEVANWKYFCMAIAYAIAIVGAAFMLKMNKIGFHLYLIAQLLIFCCLNFLIGGILKMSVMDILWIAVFVVLYATQMKSVLFSKKQNNLSE